ncbi:MAG: DUF1992 domain-containing protein [Nocardioides sp.]
MTDDERNQPDRSQPATERDERTGKGAAAARMQHQTQWVDQQIRLAMERGDFDNLPGAGKPIKGLGETHDPDWWLKQMVEREQIAVLPPSLQLRKDDAALDARLDSIHYEDGVRELVAEFNERVIRARYSLMPGPPLITMPRDVDETVAAWRERRETRRAQAAAQREPVTPSRRRRWWHRCDSRDA